MHKEDIFEATFDGLKLVPRKAQVQLIVLSHRSYDTSKEEQVCTTKSALVIHENWWEYWRTSETAKNSASC